MAFDMGREPTTHRFSGDLTFVVRVEPVGIDRARTARGMRVEAEAETRVDGRRAVRQHLVSTGEGLGPPGQRSLRYVIDAGTDRSVVFSAVDGDGNDFGGSTEVLDAVAARLDVEEQLAGRLNAEGRSPVGRRPPATGPATVRR